MKSNTHEVIRPITGAPYAAGDLVDASSWKNARALERLRYLRRIKGTPIGSEAAAPKETPPDGEPTSGPVAPLDGSQPVDVAAKKKGKKRGR